MENSMIYTLTVKTSAKEELINITGKIAGVCKQEGIESGIAVVAVPHTTAGITINENADPDVQRDILVGLKSLDLEKCSFLHAEGNSAAHIKSALMGNSVNIIIENSGILLGQWQGIYFCEFDGPRTRKIHVKFISG